MRTTVDEGFETSCAIKKSAALKFKWDLAGKLVAPMMTYGAGTQGMSKIEIRKREVMELDWFVFEFCVQQPKWVKRGTK